MISAKAGNIHMQKFKDRVGSQARLSLAQLCVDNLSCATGMRDTEVRIGHQEDGWKS